ncbi:MAG: phosphoribosylanthranilate isomerase [Leucobacter sp.]
MFIKICGLRDAQTARHAITAGADAVGVVMSERSPRNATPEQAREVAKAARASGGTSVLVVNDMPASAAADTALDLGFDILQLHGAYTARDFAKALAVIPRVWRATSLAREPQLRAGEYGEEHLLVDGATPGSGETWDVTRLSVDFADRLGDRWLLAGGLNPANVEDAIKAASPWGVDVSSGVEHARGQKDPALISSFITAARRRVAQNPG